MAANDYYNPRLSMSTNTPLSQVGNASPAPQGPPPPYQPMPSPAPPQQQQQYPQPPQQQHQQPQVGPSRPPQQQGPGWQYPSAYTEKPPLPPDPREALPYPSSAPPDHKNQPQQSQFQPPPAFAGARPPQGPYPQPSHPPPQQQQYQYPPQQYPQQQQGYRAPQQPPYQQYGQPQQQAPRPARSPGRHVRIQSPSPSTSRSSSRSPHRANGHLHPHRRPNSGHPAIQRASSADNAARYDSRRQDRDRDVSPRHHHHHSHHSGKDKEKPKTFGTFIGAGGGALVGDLIFPGLGTATGAILGGLGGRNYDRKKDSGSSRSHRSYSESGHGSRARSDRGDWDHDSDRGRRH